MRANNITNPDQIKKPTKKCYLEALNTTKRCKLFRTDLKGAYLGGFNNGVDSDIEVRSKDLILTFTLPDRPNLKSDVFAQQKDYKVVKSHGGYALEANYPWGISRIYVIGANK